MDKFSLTLWACGAAVVSFAAALVFTPLARTLARRIGAVDHPDGARKLQQQPVALLGGVEVLGGLGLTVVIAVMLGMLHSTSAIVLVSSGLALLCAVGVYDDLRNLPAKWKLVAQIATAIPILLAGCEIARVELLGFELELGAAGFLIGMAWLVACTNAVNLIDGMDGLCSTVALCVAAGVVVLGCGSGATHTVVCGAALTGSLAGFLIYNRPPATIYLGDAGSMIVGMILAMLTMQVARDKSGVTHPAIMVSLMAVPLGDILLAMIRRKLSGKSIWHPDRGHIHHRLLEHGLRVPQALAAIASICLITAAISVGAQVTGHDGLVIGALGMVVIVLVNRKLVGHVEWSLFRAMIARRTMWDSEETSEATANILRFDTDPVPKLRLHIPDESDVTEVEAPVEERRRAA